MSSTWFPGIIPGRDVPAKASAYPAVARKN